MFSEEQNGKNPEEMEQLEITELTEQEAPVVEEEEPAAEVETSDEEVTTDEEQGEAAEERTEEQAPTETKQPEEQTEKKCSGCVIKEKLAALAEKLRGLISVKKQKEIAVEEKVAEETAEECAVEEKCDISRENVLSVEGNAENPVEISAEENTVEEKIIKKPADAFALEETTDVEGTERKKPADAFEMEETAEETAVNEAEVEETADEKLFADEEEAVPAPKKIKPLHLGLVIAGGVILLAVLVYLILHALGVDLKPRNNDLLYKDIYTVEEQQLKKKADNVVATLGDEELTVSELQLYYIDSIYAFYSQNYYYLDYMGLDLAAPLSQQTCSLNDTLTWEQYFLDAAIKSWQSYMLVAMMADEDGFVVSEEVQNQIDSMETQLESIAVSYGYENASAYLSAEMAPGISVETYLGYNEVFHVSYEYLNTFYEEDYPTEREIRNFYNANKATFQDNGITPNMGLISNVRHILIKPMGGTLSEDGLETVYSDDEWNTALSEAERILEAWKAGEATEDSFATMANTYSEDPGSNTTGGLYEAIDPFSSYVPEFLNWAVDGSRQTGDTDIIQTSHGYHIMYFVSGQDYFYYVVGEQLVTDRIQTRLAGIKNKYPIDVNYKKVVLCEPVM